MTGTRPLTDDERAVIVEEAQERLLKLVPAATLLLERVLIGTFVGTPVQVHAAQAVFQGLGVLGIGGDEFDDLDLAGTGLDEAYDDDYPAADETIPIAAGATA